MSLTTLKYKQAELTTNDPALLGYLKAGRSGLIAFGFAAFGLGASMSVETPWLAIPLIVFNIFLLAFNARTLFGIWFRTITHLLSSLENGSVKAGHVQDGV